MGNIIRIIKYENKDSGEVTINNIMTSIKSPIVFTLFYENLINFASLVIGLTANIVSKYFAYADPIGSILISSLLMYLSLHNINN